ncbi:MAG TPA: hypothetical protein VM658_18740 [bacterium]|nr:hypothetical protein [bacterium]
MSGALRMFWPLFAGAMILTCFLIPASVFSQKRGLTRTEDFVVVRGRDVAAVRGSEVGSLRLYTCRNGKCKQAPAQVDKVDALGRYVFPQDKNRDRDGKLLDDNDEISFMASDCGDRMGAGQRPAGVTGGAELELRDPVDGGLAWAYLVEVPGGKPAEGLSDYVDYVAYDGAVYIRGRQFELGYKVGRINYDRLRMRMAGGALSDDVLDRQRVGMEGKMAGERSLTLAAPESIIKVEDIAVIDGPVRVIVDEIMSVHFGAISFQYGNELFMTFYRCGQNNEVDFKFPAAANTLFKSLLFYWSLDLTNDVVGSYYIDPGHSEPLVIRDETRSGVPGDRPHFWWGLYGPRGAVLQALKLDDDIVQYFTCDGRWDQDPKDDGKKGDSPGRLEIGFSCHEKGKVPEKQEYHWQNYILFPAEPTASGLAAVKNIFERPLSVKAGPLP